MKNYNNVECERCGNKWYSRKFDEEDKLPSNCPKCYQEEVKEIPEPPTKFDKIIAALNNKKEEIPQQITQKRHELKLIVENNRMLISMANMGLIISLLVGLLIYILFL